MKLGLALPMFTDDARRPLEHAARAQRLGFDGVFAADHLYPPSAPGRPSLEAFAVLSAVAALHARLHVGTLVARVSLRPPGILAKQAAALDRMSGGRAILALGTGDRHSEGEHETFSLPFPPMSERRIVLEETIVALRTLFRGEAWPGGARVPAMTGPLLPSGEPEVWVGGTTEAALGIAARTADGWNGWGLDGRAFAERAALLRELARGRPIAPSWGGIALVGEDAHDIERLRADRAARGLPMDVWSGTADQLRAFALELAGAGAAWAIFIAAGPADRMELVARTLLGP